MTARAMLLVALAVAGCSAGEAGRENHPATVRQHIFDTHDAMVSALVEGRSTAIHRTSEWRGVNLNGTPMSAEGFEDEDRVMQYDSIQVLDREVRLYGEAAALRWHANFFVKVNGEPSFAEMRLLDVYVLRDGKWLHDLMQVTPVFGTVGKPPVS